MGFTNPTPELDDLLVHLVKLAGSGKLGPGEHQIRGSPVSVTEDGTIHTIALTGIAIRRPFTALGGLRSNFSMELPILDGGKKPRLVSGTVSQSVDGFHARVREDEDEEVLPGLRTFDDSGW